MLNEAFGLPVPGDLPMTIRPIDCHAEYKVSFNSAFFQFTPSFRRSACLLRLVRALSSSPTVCMLYSLIYGLPQPIAFIDKSGEIALWVTFVIFFLSPLFFILVGLQVHTRKRSFHYINATIAIISAVSTQRNLLIKLSYRCFIAQLLQNGFRRRMETRLTGR